MTTLLNTSYFTDTSFAIFDYQPPTIYSAETLCDAAARGDMLHLIEACELEMNFNEPLSDGTTPLYHAVEQGQYEVAQYLLEKGADPQLLWGNGLGFPLRFEVDDYRMLELLLAHGLDPNLVDEGRLPLIQSVLIDRRGLNVDLLHLLCKFGVDVNASLETRGGTLTPLLYAIQSRKLGAVWTLLAYGAEKKEALSIVSSCVLSDPKSIRREFTKLTYRGARLTFQEQIRKRLLEQGQPFVKELFSLLNCGVHLEGGILEEARKRGLPLIHTLSARSALDLLRKFLNYGFSKDLHDRNGDNALTHASTVNTEIVLRGGQFVKFSS